MRLFVASFHCTIWTLLGLALLARAGAQQSSPPYKITIVEEKDDASEHLLPVDPEVHGSVQYKGNMAFNVLVDKQPLTRTAQTVFLIDGAAHQPRTTDRLLALPDGPNDKKRHGGQTFWILGDLRVNFAVEVMPGKPSDGKPGMPVPRRLDTLLIRYTILNNGELPRKVGCRLFIPTQVVNKAGALFAAPLTHPGELLDGVLLQGKELPSFLEVLEKPNVNDPGAKAIFTLQPGHKLEGPSKVVLTSQRAQGGWDVPVLPALGDSACVFYWEPREIARQGRRDIAVAYGSGVACRPEQEGRVTLEFGGSFEPRQTFTITAYVEDPVDGQHLTLLLPAGVERVAGQQMQSVPPAGETGPSVVVWRCRLAQVGSYPIRIRSSLGVTQTKIVTVAPPE